MRTDTVMMFTSEIAVAEINTLRDVMTVVIPEDFEVERVLSSGGPTLIRLTRKDAP